MAGYDGQMTLFLTALVAPAVSYVAWVLVARPLAKFIEGLIPEGHIKATLTKKRSGHY
jgi:hypothetical protein